MYLKSLELIGFKSFAEHTLMEFGTGMTTIVGPNGCGKSNISDAVRWVLGEQSAKLLRGSKMEDCIFNGTDSRKPLGMAEVSLTIADCEKTLQTEYHEITVTRRVFRSGEGQYFINKTPCRLKDIQRLFMDTGIGTNSYSLMEQGRIDLILSAHPDDRREIFEEASGITKYKTDKREALRKLEQTETNLLRLADIIKEVKRQIISLQRQAGKATRVKKLRQELRSLDIYVSRDRLQATAADLQQMETKLASLTETIEALQRDIAELDQKGQALRQSLAGAENDMDAARRAEMDFDARLQQTRQSVEISRQRTQELQEMIRREEEDRERSTADLQKQSRNLEQTRQLLDKAQGELAECEKDLLEKSGRNAAHEEALDRARQAIQGLHTESMELEGKLIKLQNEHNQMETNDRSLAGKRERCAAEQANLVRLLESQEKRLAGLEGSLKSISADVLQAEALLAARQAESLAAAGARKDLEQQRARHASETAACAAQAQMLDTHLADAGALSAGARQLLDASNPLHIQRRTILGALAEELEAEAEFRPALEAALRFWVRAIIVTNLADALELARRLENSANGAVQLLAADHPASPAPEPAPRAEAPGIRLLDHVACRPNLRPLIERLLGGARVIDSLAALPAALPAQAVFVTRAGAVVNSAGLVECGQAGPRAGADSPLARKHLLRELQEKLAGLRAAGQALDGQLAAQSDRAAAGEAGVQQARDELAARRRTLALQEGECQTVAKEVNQFREHLDTVRWEFHELEKQGSSVDARSALVLEMDRLRARRLEINAAVAGRNRELQELEQAHKGLLRDVTQANINLETKKQQREHLQNQHDPLAERIAEQKSRVAACADRIAGYQQNIESLNRSVAEARQKIPTLEAEIKNAAARLAEIRKRREAAEGEWKAAEGRINGLRDTLDQSRNDRAEINGKCIELRMKHQNLTERLTAEYRIAADAIGREPEPEWPPEGKPDAEALDNTITELRAKIEAMGPVYEGAIEEYEQLQERFTFLNQQQDDLVKAKQQLLEMIRKINQTTTELFASTFEMINTNFQTTFKQLFGGGAAKLMLADEEDILESGIEIIARPPGKRLQSVSLLSGGERTMTAVALLFAIYMVKPSPFCVLDELDAALDEPNNRRFIKMLEGFLSQSQFIIITHNQQTIAAASVIYGVTMPETGISKIVSMKFNKNEARPAVDAAGPEPGAEPETPEPAAEPETGAQAKPAAEPAGVAAATPAGAPAAEATASDDPAPNPPP